MSKRQKPALAIAELPPVASVPQPGLPHPPIPIARKRGRPPKPKGESPNGTAQSADSAFDAERYIGLLAQEAQKEGVTFEQKLKLGHIMVKWAAVKKGMSAEDKGAAWGDLPDGG